jgi:glutaredoxin 3
MDLFSRTIRPVLNRIGNPFATMASTSSDLTTNPAMASAKDLVEQTINENFVAFFSKSSCGYCRRAKNVINDLNLGEDKAVKVYECVNRPPRRPDLVRRLTELNFCVSTCRLDQLEDGDVIQEYLRKKTGQRTVPNIFISEYMLYMYIRLRLRLRAYAN